VQRILSLSVEVLGAVKQSNSEQKVLELSQKAADDLYEKFINTKN
jgi:phosphoribosyl-dephospho-CoA transferase